MTKFLDFEKPIADLEGKIDELRHLSSSGNLNIAEEVSRLQVKTDKLLNQTYKNLTPWQKVQIARHPDRPKFRNYLEKNFTDFVPLAGDRLFAEDCAIMGGPCRLKNTPVMVIGQEKGNDTESRIKHNFGMARPEGYRKAQRLMLMADRFKLPIITIVDTAGAYPGIDAEERGQSEAIAKSIEISLSVKVPIISVVIGEGGSGGAIAIACANQVFMLENSIYSVISPEGCASILWRSASKAPEASEAQRLTAQDLLKLKIIDKIIPEPVGGAHRFPDEVIQSTQIVLAQSLSHLLSLDPQRTLDIRREKFLNIGNSL